MRAGQRWVFVGFVLAVMALALTPAFANEPGAPRPNVNSTSPLNTKISGRIASPTDQHLYRFNLRQSGRALIKLTALPANLRLDVVDSHGNTLGRSLRPWLQYEEIYRYFDAGTYYVRVASQDGSFNTDRSYALRFMPLAPGLRVLTTSHWVHGSDVKVLCDALNNTRRWQIIVDMQAELVDRSGFAYAHSTAAPFTDVVGPHAHTGCEADFPQGSLRRLDHVRVSIRYQPTGFRPPPISVLPSSAARDPNFGTVFRGRLRNDGARTLRNPTVYMPFYGPGGLIVDIQLGLVDKRLLAPGATTGYSVNSYRVGPHAFFRSFVSLAVG